MNIYIGMPLDISNSVLINWGYGYTNNGYALINLPLAYEHDRRGIALCPFLDRNATTLNTLVCVQTKSGYSSLSTLNIFCTDKNYSYYVTYITIGY